MSVPNLISVVSRYSALLILILISCKPEGQNEIVTLDGWWEQVGYGNVYEINDETITAYNTTTIGCSIADEFPTAALSNNYSVTADSLFFNDGINKYRFTRINPETHLCGNIDESKQLDPLYNFDFLWETFNENYAYFDERNVNWNNLKEKYRSRLNSESSQLDLYKVLVGMTNELGDGHVGISADDEIEEAYEAELKSDDEDDGPGTIELLGLAKEIALANAENVISYNKGIVNYGSISDNILYLQVNSMMVMADYDIPDSLDQIPFIQTYFGIAEEDVDANKNEVDGIKNLMEKIDPQDFEACILDIRFNGGGKDEVGLEIMSFLNTGPYSIGNKKAFYKGEWTTPVPIHQHSANKSFNGPLVVLTSHESASAAEIMTMSVLAHPNATLIGSRTEGIFSDMLDKVLPNDWDFSLSNEVYLDHKGVNHEAKGIEPDISLDYPREGYDWFEGLQAQTSGKDEAILKALEVINGDSK